MIARAFGPGSAVFRSGIVVIIGIGNGLPLRASFLLPARARRTVLEQDPLLGETVADPIRRGKVAPAARCLTFLHEPLDLLDRNRRLRVLGPTHRDDAEHAVEVVDGAPYHLYVRHPDLLSVDRGV